jgi:hypothetical protein
LVWLISSYNAADWDPLDHVLRREGVFFGAIAASAPIVASMASFPLVAFFLHRRDRLVPYRFFLYNFAVFLGCAAIMAAIWVHLTHMLPSDPDFPRFFFHATASVTAMQVICALPFGILWLRQSGALHNSSSSGREEA